jgi:acyl carrier protein
MAAVWTPEKVLGELVLLVKDMTQDFEVEFENEIGPASRFVGDLEFESTDIVELLGAVETKFQRKKLPFDKLILKNGRYSDFSIQELADFLVTTLNTPAAGAAA